MIESFWFDEDDFNDWMERQRTFASHHRALIPIGYVRTIIIELMRPYGEDDARNNTIYDVLRALDDAEKKLRRKP